MVARRNAARVVRDEQQNENPIPRATKIARELKISAQPTANELNRVIHERMRLGIVSALAVNDGLSFTDLKELMQTTDGNLSIHARRLEEAGYVACSKTFDGRTPKTEYKITAQGRKALESYINHMEALIRMMRKA